MFEVFRMKDNRRHLVTRVPLRNWMTLEVEPQLW